MLQTYSLRQLLKKFSDKGYKAAYGEMKQLHERECFIPMDVLGLTPMERKQALKSLIFLIEKRDGRIKA